MADEKIIVKITLRKHVADRLKQMCYTRNLTASDLVDSWVLSLPDDGKIPIAVTPKRSLLESDGDFFRQVVDEIRQRTK